MNIYFYDNYGRFGGHTEFDMSHAIPEQSTFVAPPNETEAWLFTHGGWHVAPGGELPQLYNTPDVIEVTNDVPAEVSNIQAFAAIKHFGMLPAVKAYMASLPLDNLTRVTWEKATTFKRTSPTLQAIAQTLDLSDDQLDAMFKYAATVVV